MNVASTNASASLPPNPNNNNNAFPGDNFSNNLFTDLAPLLALFGEQMTKQFLSMSLGWADNLLLGMAPVGILTVVISAIRIGGTRSLKAIIGRFVMCFTMFQRLSNRQAVPFSQSFIRLC